MSPHLAVGADHGVAGDRIPCAAPLSGGFGGRSSDHQPMSMGNAEIDAGDPLIINHFRWGNAENRCFLGWGNGGRN